MPAAVELVLDVSAGPQSGVFSVAGRSPGGEATGPMQLDVAYMLSARRQLQSTVLASAVVSRRAFSETEEPVRKTGQALFEALFSEAIYGVYTASMAVARERGVSLRVVLNTRAPELAALPWEMLYDPNTGKYLCQREPLIRHVEAPAAAAPLSVHPPLRILGLVAAPGDLPTLDTAGERRRLTEALADLGDRVELHWVRGGTWRDLLAELVAGDWHALHFIGHGGFDPARGEGFLALEDGHGGTDLIGADRFSHLLTTQEPPPQLVVLNSCAGAQSAADDLFSSTAAALVRAGATAAAAMQFAVSDPAAKAFAAGFYQAIAHNHSVADAVRVGRIGIRGTGEDTLEWVTPVLYLRGQDAPLFNVLRHGRDAAAPGPNPVQAATQAGVKALYQQAMANYRTGKFSEAVLLFDSVLSLDPQFQDAAARREVAAREQQSIEAYESGLAAEERGEWQVAAVRYTEVLQVNPNHADAATRRASVERKFRIANLQDELRLHAEAQDWAAVLNVANDLAELDPNAADPDGLATTARKRLGAASPRTGELRTADISVRLEPDVAEIRGAAKFSLTVTNRGDDERHGVVNAEAGGWHVDAPASITVPSSSSQTVTLTVSPPRRNVVGRPVVQPIAVTFAPDHGATTQAQRAVIRHKPLLPTSVVTIAGILVIGVMAVAVWLGTRTASEPLPDVTSLTAQDAETRLTGAGFTRIELVREESRTEASEEVLRTDPAPGAKINRADSVKVFVSTGFHRTVQVPSNQPVTDSGIDVSTGETVTVQASGRSRYTHPADPNRETGPEGDPDPSLREFNLQANDELRNANHAALIAQVGNDDPFVVGANKTFVADTSGRLSFTVNDWGTWNNSGDFTAEVSVTRS
jgi:tetratricopeptide (TPR) repeat protein